LDDFGTGFANLSQVVSLPFTMVKIDRELLHGSKIVLEDLLRMFKRLGLTTVIEGIETEDQSLLLQSMDVDYIQGFYYALPMNEIDFIDSMK
jgi:EAL domain-containing protein (putative c-di-GMP-specific phosphodiesterase class I)